MRCIEMTDALWRRLLSWRSGRHRSREHADDPAFALYGPIAVGDGPFVLAQVGQSLDGRVATPFGDAKDISGPEGIAHLHRCRALVDAVIVGVGTVKADNPQLSVRHVEGADPVRVIIDRHAELSGTEGLFHDNGAPVILIQSEEAPRRSYRADVIRLPHDRNGICPAAILAALTERNLHKVLVEGGARTISRFLDLGLIDRLHVSIAPIIIGSGPAGISLPPIRTLAEARRPKAEIYRLGSEILFDCRFAADETSALDRESGEIEATQAKAPAVEERG